VWESVCVGVWVWGGGGVVGVSGRVERVCAKKRAVGLSCMCVVPQLASIALRPAVEHLTFHTKSSVTSESMSSTWCGQHSAAQWC
jgi:hypothetical protein